MHTLAADILYWLIVKNSYHIHVSEFQESVVSSCNLLAMPVGIKQKSNVDTIVQKVSQSISIYVLQIFVIYLFINQPHRLPNFCGISFFQRILLSFCSIMMVIWMGGWT